jgi:hypothetical protein
VDDKDEANKRLERVEETAIKSDRGRQSMKPISNVNNACKIDRTYYAVQNIQATMKQYEVERRTQT